MKANKEHIAHLTKEIFQKLVSWRQYLHQNPELSFQEYKTAQFVSEILEEHQIEHQKGIASTGIVALIKGKNPELRCIALRADMDALPIQELGNKLYQSKNEGVMHACGHDFHTTSLLGVALVLNQLKEQFEGSIKLIFQPSEEKLPSGAAAMIAEGVLENPKVDYILGQHVSPELTTGTFGFCSGQFMASADEIYLTVKGKGGHAAFPHLLNDTVLAASQIIVNMQQVVSRKRSPFQAAVLSFGKVEALGATNIIPNEVAIAGTLRALDETFRKDAHRWIYEIAIHTAESFGCICDVDIKIGNPSLFNDVTVTANKMNLAKEYHSTIEIVNLPPRMGGEDFAWYSQEIPALFYRVGTGNTEKNTTNGLHTPQFDVDDDALLHSVGLMVWLAINP